MDSGNKGYEAAREKILAYHKGVGEKAREKYLSNPRYCAQCGNVLPYEKRREIYRFCSNSCAASYNNARRKTTKRSLICLKCGASLVGRAGDKFCSKVCEEEYKLVLSQNEYEEYIRRWLVGAETGTMSDGSTNRKIRRWFMEKHGGKCSECGWSKTNQTTGTIPLNLDHIDGDSRNNKPDNLRLLCPNCHSLTPTYGSLNKGKGRLDRRTKAGKSGL